MIAVCDASAGIEVTLQREDAKRFRDIIGAADWVIAPSLFIAETTNAFWKLSHVEGFSLADCEKGLEYSIGLIDDFVSDRDLYREAFSLSQAGNHPAYDMFYCALARRHNGRLLTNDRRLRSIAEKHSIRTA